MSFSSPSYVKFDKKNTLNQRSWTYFDQQGQRNTLGLAHSPTSGNLMVYYNKEILIIDFQINYAKEYTFYIDDELCHLYIKDRQGQYDYELQIDHDANTPRNLARKQKEREEWLMKFKISGASLLIIIFVYFLFFIFYKKN